jgi:GWxTD domain-containing protein
MNKQRRGISLVLAVSGLFALLAFFAGCHLYHLEQELKPADAEFLSKVRYIVTAEERKTFLMLPDEDKPKFIEEFWQKRDPDPYTEENEFKIEYTNRLDMATELFRGEGRPGWMTDRGRIYILFGPPLDRLINPAGLNSGSSRCTEVWYYGQFPVVFNDEGCNGDFRLVTYDLTALREVNLAYMMELHKAQDNAQQPSAQQPFAQEKSLFDFDWDIQKTIVQPDRVEGLVVVEVPLANIWFTAVQDKLETVLEIQLQLKDSEGKVFWERKESIPVKTTEEELKVKMKDKVRKEIPFVFDKDLDKLRKGKNQMTILMKNSTGNESQRKSQAFTL